MSSIRSFILYRLLTRSLACKTASLLYLAVNVFPSDDVKLPKSVFYKVDVKVRSRQHYLNIESKVIILEIPIPDWDFKYKYLTYNWAPGGNEKNNTRHNIKCNNVTR